MCMTQKFLVKNNLEILYLYQSIKNNLITSNAKKKNGNKQLIIYFYTKYLLILIEY